jgi:hypothetical protein
VEDAERVVADFFQAFYTQFILRDLLGKVAPGAILLGGLTLSFIPFAKAVEHGGQAGFGAWVVAGAVAWLLGISLQGLGEIVHFIRYYPRSVPDREWRRKLAKFHAEAKASQAQHFERFVVIKEACGNAVVAIVVTTAIIAAMRWGTTAGYLAFAALAAIPGLVKMHFANAARGYDYLNAVIGEVPPESESDVPHNNQMQLTAPAQATERRS